MSEQAPHVEVFSRNRISRSTVILGVIPVTLFSGVLIFALWQFLFWIAIGVLVLLTIGALYLIAIAAIDIRRRWIHAHVVHLGEHGVVDALGWRMLPLALPPPVVVSEEKEEDEDMQRAKVLTCYDIGMHLKDIEKSTGVKYWKVQKWTSEYAAKKANR